MRRVFEGEKTRADFLLQPLERLIYKLTKVDPAVAMDWKPYALSFILFGLVGPLCSTCSCASNGSFRFTIPLI
jgi:K+-transporting ATPase A subunit